MLIDKIDELLDSGRFWAVLILLPLTVCGSYFLWQKYDELFRPAEELPFYGGLADRHDDTLRVAVIGDSWAEYHTTLHCDTIFVRVAKSLTDQPVKCFSRGKGGAMSKEIYHFMFASETEEHPWEPDRCTQPLIEQHPDYCVVMAGINDAIFQRGLDYYKENYRLMLRLLLHNGIRPVAMEIPTVDAATAIDYKTYFKRSAYHLKAILLGTRGNRIPQYRSALRTMLDETGLKDSVLFIPADRWSTVGWRDTTMFLRDRIHMKIRGYQVLDSCIAAEVINDYEARRRAAAPKPSMP